MYPDAMPLSPRQKPASAEARLVVHHMTLGLIEGLVRMSVENGVIYWCATMERQLLRLLTRLGIYFENIGPPVEHHGTRQPCYQYLPTLLERVREERSDVWEVITNEGLHWEKLCSITSRTWAP